MLKRNAIGQYVRTDKFCEINNCSTHNPGGYRMYFKLFTELINKIELTKSVLTKSQYCKIMLIAYLKFPWWCIVKPLGQFFTVLTEINGKYKVTEINGVITFGNDTVVKSKTYKLFGVTYFYYQTDLTQEDIQELK
jgi:hypothetical protein